MFNKQIIQQAFIPDRAVLIARRKTSSECLFSAGGCENALPMMDEHVNSSSGEFDFRAAFVQLQLDYDRLSEDYVKVNLDYTSLQAKNFSYSSSDSTVTRVSATKRKCTAENRFKQQSLITQNHKSSGVQVKNSFDILSDSMDTHAPLNNDTPNHHKNGLFSRSLKPTPISQKQVSIKPPATSTPTKTISQSTSSARNKNVRPPPIVAYALNHKDCTSKFPELIGEGKFSLTKVNSACSRIQLETKDDYKKIKAALVEAEIAFHSFTPNDEKPTSVILRYLCPTFEDEDIKDALMNLDLNIQIRSIVPYQTEFSKRSGQKLDLWLIQLEPQSDVSSLLKTTRLLHQKVKFERRKQSGTSQCFKCQHFGHSSKNCNRPYRCVKCTENHKPGECPLPEKRQHDQELPPTCVNCGEHHTANFRGCKAYIAHIKRSHQKSTAQQQEQIQENRRFTSSSKRVEGISYASTVQAHATPKMHQNNCLDFLDAECNAYFGSGFDSIIAQTSKFMPKYAATSPENKPFALIRFIMSITPTTSP